MLIDQIKSLPSEAGVYQYFDKFEKLLYVGKAKSQSIEDHGVQVARVRVAHRLTVGQEDALIAKLTQIAGRPVTLDVTVDRDLIGGITVDMDGELRDASIARRLEDLHHALAEAQ